MCARCSHNHRGRNVQRVHHMQSQNRNVLSAKEGLSVSFLKTQISQVLFLLLFLRFCSYSTTWEPVVTWSCHMFVSSLQSFSPKLHNCCPSAKQLFFLLHPPHLSSLESHRAFLCDRTFSAPPAVLFIRSSLSLLRLYFQGRLRPPMMSPILP